MRHDVSGLVRNGRDSHLNLHQDDATHKASGYADTRALRCIDFDHESSKRVATLSPIMTSRRAEVSRISGAPWDAGNQVRLIAKFDVTTDSNGRAQLLERDRLEAWDTRDRHVPPLAVLRVVHRHQLRPKYSEAIHSSPARLTRLSSNRF